MVDTAERNSADIDRSGTTKQHIYGFSYIRSLACIAIIILHTVYSAVLLFGSNIDAEKNIISMAVVDSMMWAVPCFIMVTGALLLL